jgi:hypothetical protein
MRANTSTLDKAAKEKVTFKDVAVRCLLRRACLAPCLPAFPAPGGLACLLAACPRLA